MLGGATLLSAKRGPYHKERAEQRRDAGLSRIDRGNYFGQPPMICRMKPTMRSPSPTRANVSRIQFSATADASRVLRPSAAKVHDCHHIVNQAS
jgi:hypothetical protein